MVPRRNGAAGPAAAGRGGKMPPLLLRIVREGVVTHHGSDLDQVLAVEALRRAAQATRLKVDRTAAGCPVAGRVNVDVGDERATQGITVCRDDTVMIDHHFNGYGNTLEVLVDAGFYVPPQAVRIADRCDQVSILDWRLALSLVPWLDAAQVWELAQAGALDRRLTDEELKDYGLSWAAARQRVLVDAAVAAVQKHAVNDSLIFVPEFVRYGAQVAYELGYGLYCSVAPKDGGGVTLAVTARPGTTLPGHVLAWGERLRERFGSGVYLSPRADMLVAGGPKNPRFSLPLSVEEVYAAVTGAVAGGPLEG